MNIENPRVSVVIPAYRCAETIDKAIRSVLIQDVPLEVLVINDASPDDVDSVMEKYKEDERVVYIKNKKNMGAAKTRNKGVALANAPYVAFLDSDDLWRPGKLKKQLNCLNKTKGVLCSTARELMTADGKKTGRVLPVNRHLTYEMLLKHNSIVCSSVVLRTDVAREFPMIYEDSHEDYIVWMQILRKYGKGYGINEPLVLYRQSASGKSGSKLKSAMMTWKAYRYMGFGWLQSMRCFVSYTWNGVKKYYL